MAIASVHASVLMLTSYMDDLNYQLTMLSEKRQLVSSQESAIIQQYTNASTNSNAFAKSSSAYTNAISGLVSAATSTDATALQNAFQALTAASSTSTTNWTQDARVQLLELQDNQLDMQQKQIETKLKAVTANLESQQKLEDNNIKNDFTRKMSL